MAKFNFRKNAEKTTRKPYEKQLIENNKEFDLKPADNRPYEKQLEDDRAPNKDGKNYEKLLEDARVASPNIVTEKQLNADASKRSDEGVVLMDMGEKTSKASEKKFKDVQSKEKRSKPFYEKYNNPLSPNDNAKTTIINNVQDSQMVSNYEDRKDFEKSNPSVKKAANAVKSIKDADALLYHIYRKAADERRSLDSKEQKSVNNINKEKISILSNIK